jgi:hypothetical protein
MVQPLEPNNLTYRRALLGAHMLERHHLIADRFHHKGTAFTKDERNRFHLHGILPPVVEDRDTHLACVRTE